MSCSSPKHRRPRPRPWPPSRARSARGYTLVEAMVTALVATIGFAALIDLQGHSLAGVREAHDRTQATAMGEHFVEMVRMMSQRCGIPDASAVCSFLPPPGQQVGVWTQYTRPEATTDLLTVSPGVFDGENPGDIDYGLSREFTDERQLRYCVHYQTAWIVQNRLFRVDVRVLWPHADTDIAAFEGCELELVNTTGTPMQVGHVTVSAAIARGGL